jgi:DNA-binding GntR family transcriptional regulator
MLTQEKIDALTARIKALEPKVAQLEANQQPPVDSAALEAELTTLEQAVDAGLPAEVTPPPAA